MVRRVKQLGQPNSLAVFMVSSLLAEASPSARAFGPFWLHKALFLSEFEYSVSQPFNATVGNPAPSA